MQIFIPISEQTVLKSQTCGINTSSELNRLKIKYLLTQKQKIQTELKQLKQNNILLRQIYDQIAHDRKIQMSDLNKIILRNQQLENMITKLSQENKQVRTQIFIANQIGMENLKEYKEIFNNYQHKILEMRQLLYSKEVFVQEIEDQNRSKKQQKGAFQYCFDLTGYQKRKLQFFDLLKQLQSELIIQIKKGIQLQMENYQLKLDNQLQTQFLQSLNPSSWPSENKTVSNKNQQVTGLDYQNNIAKILELVKGKAMNSQSTMCSRSLIGENPNIKYANKYDEVPEKYRQKLSILEKLIKKRGYEVEQANNKIRMLKNKLQTQNYQMIALKQSNLKYQTKLNALTKLNNYYENLVAHLYSSLCNKKRNVVTELLYAANFGNKTIRNPQYSIPGRQNLNKITNSDDQAYEYSSHIKIENKFHQVKKQASQRISKQDWLQISQNLEKRLSSIRQKKPKFTDDDGLCDDGCLNNSYIFDYLSINLKTNKQKCRWRKGKNTRNQRAVKIESRQFQQNEYQQLEQDQAFQFSQIFDKNCNLTQQIEIVEGNTSVLNKNWMRNIRTSINILDKESRGRAEDKMQKRNVNLQDLKITDYQDNIIDL